MSTFDNLPEEIKNMIPQDMMNVLPPDILESLVEEGRRIMQDPGEAARTTLNYFAAEFVPTLARAVGEENYNNPVWREQYLRALGEKFTAHADEIRDTGFRPSL